VCFPGILILDWGRFVLYMICGMYVIINEVRELIAVKVIRTSLLNTTMFAFKILSLGSYKPTPASSPTFKIILELVLWNGFQNCR